MSRSVSIVVPAYNEERLLPRCLDSLLAQDYAGPLEILVVNNASTDRTAQVARRPGVTVLDEPRRGYGAALIRGFAAARGEILISTDADTAVPRNWVSGLAGAYDSHPDVVAVGGEIEFEAPSAIGALFTRGLLPFLNRADRRNPRGPHLWGANFSVRRDAFLRAGGWNPRFSLQTDTELSERLRAQGRVVLLEGVRVRTSSRRWNAALLPSLFLYGTNFLWFHAFARPLWRDFPAIREPAVADADAPAFLGARGRPAPRPRSRRLVARWAAAAAAAAAMIVGFSGYAALTPWSSAFGRTYWSGPTGSAVVALTFDDGPEEPYTSQVLAILRRERVRATFFLVGENVRRFPQTAALLVREGQAVGNHSDVHAPAMALAPADWVARDVDRAEATIHAATGVYPHFFRPPQGIRSPWLMRVLARDSLVAVTWDDAPRDWEARTPSELVASTIRQAHPGAIILLHDGLNLDHHANRSATVAALPGIIRGLRARGYAFVTVPELLHDRATLEVWRPVPGAAPRVVPALARHF